VLVWEAWKAFAHRASSYQTRVILIVVYLLVLGPAASVGRLFGARLLDLESIDASRWVVRPQTEPELSALRRQF
jgi:hypothetical protein